MYMYFAAHVHVQFAHIYFRLRVKTISSIQVCGLKWADLSDSAFGVALLDDCKYGYSTRDNVMSLSL